ncbi:MAG: hypothetical protein ACYSUI_11935 [Planctomycetota bacterium]|jgi:ferredoxin-NADP reductase
MLLTSTENTTLCYRRDLNEDLSILRVRPDTGVVPDFVPGQYTTLGLPAGPPIGVANDDEVGQCHVFLCGNPDMIQSVRPFPERRGFCTHSKRSPGNIHLERYW